MVARYAGAMASSTAKRADDRRREKLEKIQERIEAGALTIRKMTPEERKLYPPRPAKLRKPYRA